MNVNNIKSQGKRECDICGKKRYLISVKNRNKTHSVCESCYFSGVYPILDKKRRFNTCDVCNAEEPTEKIMIGFEGTNTYCIDQVCKDCAEFFEECLSHYKKLANNYRDYVQVMVL